MRQRASLLLRQLLDLFDDGFVLVEVVALEFRDCAAEVVGGEVVGRVVGEVVDEPAVAEGGVGYVGYSEFFGCGDEVVGFVEGFEGGVFGLEGVDFGDCSNG